MGASGGFGERVAAYGAWRGELAESVRRFGLWLADAELSDPQTQARLERILDRLGQDRMSLAFIAEFSRGKSELINAIFFGSYGQRILPSSAGRTTMCPTELMYDARHKPSIRLLPIETRLRETSLAELRNAAGEWNEIGIDADDAESVRKAFESVREVKRVTVEDATMLGLYDAADEESPVRPDGEGMIEVPRWRHAIVNIPHPLLELGLQIIDTPGLNAIGSEPELTLNLIPNADAVLFMLAADAGVTRTDIEVWREHISASHQSGRLVVLNKIDGLWDDLRDEAQIELEISRQVSSVSQTLGIPPDRVFPVSAQKGLVGRVHNDPALLKRSRLLDLERALSRELVPQQQELVREHVRREFDELYGVAHSVLAARRRATVEQLFELNGLRGKNRNVVDHMGARIRAERAEFEKSLRHLQALRAVFSRHSQAIFTSISIDALKRHVRGARESMKSSQLTVGLRDGMDSLMTSVRGDFVDISKLIDEITTLMTAMYKQFNAEYGMSLGAPILFSTRRYLGEIERIEALYRKQFGAITMMTTEKWALMRRFFESVAARIRELYELATREIEGWLRAIMAPVEGQVREHQAQLKRRLDSVKRVLEATDTLESRISEIDGARDTIERKIGQMNELSDQLRSALGREVRGEELQPA